MPKAGPVWLIRKLLLGALRWNTTVEPSGAIHGGEIEAAPKPPNAAA